MNHYFLTAILYRNLSAFDIERIRNDGCTQRDNFIGHWAVKIDFGSRIYYLHIYIK